MIKKLGEHAIVIGGSMAGMLAARVLSDYFKHVTVIERDRYEPTVAPRKGIPQGNHAHGLLARGFGIMARLFPTLPADLAAQGAIVGNDPGRQFNMYQFGGFRIPYDSEIRGAIMSRPLLDWAIRKAMADIPSITIKAEHSVEELIADEHKSRVIGVLLHAKAEDALPEALYADLVVDTSGRGSQMGKWVEGMGYTRVEESTVKVNVGYASRIYTRSIPNEDKPISCIVTSTPPTGKRFGVRFAIEGQRWLITLAGTCGDTPATDEEGFRAYARSLPASEIADIVENEEPLTDITQYKFPANFRRHYERMTRFPEGLLVMGDALCSFNPLYGQGMTTSALEAEALQQLLATGATTDGIAQRFYKASTPIVDGAWQLATGEDFRYPEVEGVRTAGTLFLHRYIAAVHRATHTDPVVHDAFVHVMHMMAPPPSLMRPAIMFRVLRHALFGSRKASLVKLPSSIPVVVAHEPAEHGQTRGWKHVIE